MPTESGEIYADPTLDDLVPNGGMLNTELGKETVRLLKQARNYDQAVGLLLLMIRDLGYPEVVHAWHSLRREDR